MRMKMIDMETEENILSALQNLANGSLMLKETNDFVGGESTRVINIYNQLIFSNKDNEEYKTIYEKAKLVCFQCDKIDMILVGLKELILDLLHTIGKIEQER